MAEAKSKKTEAAKKIVDVKSEGDAASGTSRPVIVDNRAVQKDPMMAEVSQLTGGLAVEPSEPVSSDNDDKPTKDSATSGAPTLTLSGKKLAIKIDEAKATEPDRPAAEAPIAAPSKKKIVIKPLSQSDSDKATEPAPASEPQPTVADLAKPDPLPAKSAEAAEPVATSDDTTTESATPTSQTEADQSTDKTSPDEADAAPAADAEATSGLQPGRSFDEADAASTETANEVAPEQIELDGKGHPKTKRKSAGQLTAEQQKAIESGEYFLPITTAETRRLRREILFASLLVLVMIVVWIDIMLDAELLKLGGLQALTDFF